MSGHGSCDTQGLAAVPCPHGATTAPGTKAIGGGAMGFGVQLWVPTLCCPHQDPKAPTDSGQPGPEQRSVVPRWVLACVTPREPPDVTLRVPRMRRSALALQRVSSRHSSTVFPTLGLSPCPPLPCCPCCRIGPWGSANPSVGGAAARVTPCAGDTGMGPPPLAQGAGDTSCDI